MNLSETPQKIREILALRACGWSISSLSIYYSKDRTSIRHHLQKYDVRPLTPVIDIHFVRPKMRARLDPTQKYHFEDEPVNAGHTYQEYIRMAKKRHPEEKYHQLPIRNGRVSDILVDIL